MPLVEGKDVLAGLLRCRRTAPQHLRPGRQGYNLKAHREALVQQGRQDSILRRAGKGQPPSRTVRRRNLILSTPCASIARIRGHL